MLSSMLIPLKALQTRRTTIELMWVDKATLDGAQPIAEWVTGKHTNNMVDRTNLVDLWKNFAQGCNLSQQKNDLHVEVYPNPATTELTVSLSSALKVDVKAQVSIVNLQGTTVSLAHKESHGTYYFDVADIVNGTYLVSVVWENGARSVQKILISK